MICENFAYILKKKADYYPDDIVISEGHNGKRYRYGELHSAANRLANVLLDIGLSKGDRVLCLTLTTVEFLEIFFAAARLGIMVVQVNYRLAPNEILRILEETSPKVLFFDSRFKEKARAIKDHRTDIRNYIVFGDNRCSWAGAYKKITRNYSEIGPPIDGNSESPCLMLFTAGSTGRPKGVPLSHRNLFFASLNGIIDLGFTKWDYLLNMSAFFHIGGLVWTLSHIHMGARVMLYPQFDAEATLRLIQQEKITTIMLATTKIKMIMRVPGWENYDLSSLRFIIVGGEPVPAAVTEAFAKQDISILNAYGMTETTNGTLFLRPEHAADKPANCIGKTFTNVEAMVADNKGNEVGLGQEGELLHRGPTVINSYWQRPEENAKVFRDGWLHTGDRVVKDNDGFYYFIGRTDEMIISGGENVFPAEVEEIIFAYNKVVNVAVIGVPDDLWGCVVKAIIVPKEGMTITEEEITEHVKKHLAGFKKPKIIEFVNDLPTLESGKLDRHKIKQMYTKPAFK